MICDQLYKFTNCGRYVKKGEKKIDYSNILLTFDCDWSILTITITYTYAYTIRNIF